MLAYTAINNYLFRKTRPYWDNQDQFTDTHATHSFPIEIHPMLLHFLPSRPSANNRWSFGVERKKAKEKEKETDSTNRFHIIEPAGRLPTGSQLFWFVAPINRH